jgi:hypothetical protein
MWKEIHIKIIDQLKGTSDFEFYPTDKIKAIKLMLKDNGKEAYEDYILKFQGQKLDDEKTIMESGIKNEDSVTVHHF